MKKVEASRSNRITSLPLSRSQSLTDTLRLTEDDNQQDDTRTEAKGELQIDCYKLNEISGGQQAAKSSEEHNLHVLNINHQRRQHGRTSSGILALIRAIDEDERNFSLLLRSQRNETHAEPVCISEARLARLRTILNQLKQIVLEEEREESTFNESSLNCCSVGRLSIGDIGADNHSGPFSPRNAGQQAQISRRIWRHKNNNDESGNLSISLASGLDGSRESTTKLQSRTSSKKDVNNNNRKKDNKTTKLDTGKQTKRRDSKQTEQQFVASRYGNKEALL